MNGKDELYLGHQGVNRYVFLLLGILGIMLEILASQQVKVNQKRDSDGIPGSAQGP
jgi:hypothetical protein